MPRFSTQRDFRRLHQLGFCYLCGAKLDDESNITREHVAPKCVFALDDRTPPLILPAHSACNNNMSLLDQQVGQMFGIMHGKQLPERHRKIDPILVEDPSTGRSLGGIRGPNLNRFVFRLLQGFHVALYNEYLPEPPDTLFSISHSTPSGTFQKGQIQWDPLPEVHEAFVGVVHTNRMSDRLDSIRCYNDRCRYDCVWEKLDGGRPACIFALDIYDLLRFGDTGITPARSTVGLYAPLGGRPSSATVGTRVHLPEGILPKLNAFGSDGG